MVPFLAGMTELVVDAKQLNTISDVILLSGMTSTGREPIDCMNPSELAKPHWLNLPLPDPVWHSRQSVPFPQGLGGQDGRCATNGVANLSNTCFHSYINCL